VHETTHVGVEHPVPLGGVRLVERGGEHDARVGYDEVDRAELHAHGLREGLEGFGVGDVDRDRNGRRALELGDEVAQSLLAAADQGDRGAVGREPPRRRGSDAAGRAGHDSDPAGERTGAGFLSGLSVGKSHANTVAIAWPGSQSRRVPGRAEPGCGATTLSCDCSSTVTQVEPDIRIGQFLRARRELVQPEDVGIESYGRRRVPGLRREELAMLAGVSVDYYVRLEQGRERHPSERAARSPHARHQRDALDIPRPRRP
jgi:hypothetical protein